MVDSIILEFIEGETNGEIRRLLEAYAANPDLSILEQTLEMIVRCNTHENTETNN